MKKVLPIIVFLLIGWLISFIIPVWWLYAGIAFMIALIFKLSEKSGFITLFLGGILLWGGMALSIQLQTESTIAFEVSNLFGIGSGFLLMVLTALIGGIVSGLGGWSGACMNRLINRKKR
jgi:hypothetical protein